MGRKRKGVWPKAGESKMFDGGADEHWAAIEAALEEPDLIGVGVSWLMFQEVDFSDSTCVSLGDVPGRVLAFFYEREKENVRFTTLDHAGSMWALDFAREPDHEQVRVWRETVRAMSESLGR